MTQTNEHDHEPDDFFLDPELHAYVDGKLPPDRAAVIEARLGGDKPLGEAVESWMEARTLIRAAASAADNAPVDMRTELLARELTARVRRGRFRALVTGPGLRQLAAGVVIFAAGWTGNAYFVEHAAPLNPSYEARFLQTILPGGGPDGEMMTPSDTRIAHALQALSPAIGGAVNYPALDEFGLSLVHAAVTEGPAGPAVRLYYDTDSGKRISVMMTRHPESEPAYPIQVRSLEGHMTAYLTHGSVDYAISGEDDPVVLATLAKALN